MATVFGDADAEREARRVATRMRLPAAIQSGAIRPVFQSQLDQRNDRLIGCEILARWVDVRVGSISPRDFVEVAELSNQIELLTMSVVEQAIETRLADPSGRPVPLSVNLSAGLMANDAFVLSRLGCRRGQGYLLAPPMDPRRAAVWVDRSASLVGAATRGDSTADLGANLKRS